MPSLTRREIYTAIIVGIAFILIMLFGKKIPANDDWEYLFLFLFVLPLGIYIVTDPERRNNTKD